MKTIISGRCANELKNVTDIDPSVVYQADIDVGSSGVISFKKAKKDLRYYKPDEQSIELQCIEGCPFALLEDEKLRNIGVPASFFAHVRNISDFDAINHLPIPEETREILQYWLAHHRKKLLDSLKGTNYVAESKSKLDRFYRRDITELLLRLYDDQEVLVKKRTTNTPLIVKGTVGSGKTTIALYRMLRFAKEGHNTLYLTFNNSLAQAAHSLITAFEGKIPPGVNISTIDKLCMDYLKKIGGIQNIKLVDNQWKQDDLLKKAIDAVKGKMQSRLFKRDLSFWEYEIKEIIKGRAKADYNTYMEIERVGTGFSLDKHGQARKVVWQVFKEYEKRKGRKFDFSDLSLHALKYVKNMEDHWRFDYVFIDEAQDFRKTQMEVALNMVKDPSQLFVVADAAQSIYQKGFRWNDFGISIGSRNVYELQKNHRNTKEILTAAQSLIESDEELRESEEIVLPEFSKKKGPKPRLIFFRTIREQREWIVQDIIKRIRTGDVIPKNIAVISKKNYDVNKITEELNNNGVKAKLGKKKMDFDEDAVKCITFHSSKGLEFPLVYLLGVDNKRIPGKYQIDDDEKEGHLLTERKLLYVGLTRAMNELVITCNKNGYSPFLNEIQREHLSYGVD